MALQKEKETVEMIVRQVPITLRKALKGIAVSEDKTLAALIVEILTEATEKRKVK